jgi:hypothetical protein
MAESISKRYPPAVSIAVFGFALVIVLMNTVSLLFPALYVSLLDGLEVEGDPFELGVFFVPIVLTNVSVLIFGVLYYTKKMPRLVRGGIDFIRSYEVSRGIAAVLFAAIIFSYIGLSIPDLSIDESQTYGDFQRVKRVVDKWPFEKDVPELSILHVKNFLLKSSDFFFQNLRVIPFVVSILLVALTYFFTVELTQKRVAGLVAMMVLVQSYTFQVFDTIASYENSWVLFYLLSLFLILKRWYLSPVSYVASIFSKALTAAYLPMTLFFTYISDIPRKRKFYILFSYIAIAIAGIVGVYAMGVDFGGEIAQRGLTFDYYDFWNAFAAWSFQLRFDYTFLLFIIPLTVALFLVSRKGATQADSALILIAGTIIAMPLLAAFSGYNLHPYRYIPLVVFFAIGVGVLLSKKTRLA